MALRLVTLADLVDRPGAAAGCRADERALLPADQRANTGARGGRSADDERRFFPRPVLDRATLRRRVARGTDAADTVRAVAVHSDMTDNRSPARATVHECGTKNRHHARRLSINR